MITKEIKISKMLAAYPQTLEVLLQASPHFSKLKNKLLRKALAGRVNVEQAAGIAGVSLNNLLLNLNSAIGERNKFLSTIKSNNEMNNNKNISDNKPEFLSALSLDEIFILDVRKDISEGNDPLKKIMETAKGLKENHVLLLINSFEPIPLYAVMKRKGYNYWTEKNNNEWKIYFYKTPDSVAEENVQPKLNRLEITGDEEIIEIDVRGMEPPGPMIKILEAISKMDCNTVLLVHHHREPVMLYEKLEERGFGAVANKIEDNYFKVLIKKMKTAN